MSECIVIKRFNDQLKAGLDPNKFVPHQIPLWMSKDAREEYLMWCIVHLTDGREEEYRRMLYASWAEDV